jgi:sterol 24-C-methyltransferase
MAHALGLKPGMVVADIGCGVGGPLMEIARFSGAKIVGVNNNACQLERARTLTEEAKLTDLADFIHCDFLSVAAPDESLDAAYSIEASCCAPDKISVYSEIYRLLNPAQALAPTSTV